MRRLQTYLLTLLTVLVMTLQGICLALPEQVTARWLLMHAVFTRQDSSEFRQPSTGVEADGHHIQSPTHKACCEFKSTAVPRIAHSNYQSFEIAHWVEKTRPHILVDGVTQSHNISLCSQQYFKDDSDRYLELSVLLD